jgi:hypothetical protein
LSKCLQQQQQQQRQQQLCELPAFPLIGRAAKQGQGVLGSTTICKAALHALILVPQQHAMQICCLLYQPNYMQLLPVYCCNCMLWLQHHDDAALLESVFDSMQQQLRADRVQAAHLFAAASFAGRGALGFITTCCV